MGVDMDRFQCEILWCVMVEKPGPSTTYSLQGNRESKVALVRMARPRGWLWKGAVAQPPRLGIFRGGVTWIWDTFMRHVRGLGHVTLMEYAIEYSLAAKNHQRRG